MRSSTVHVTPWQRHQEAKEATDANPLRTNFRSAGRPELVAGDVWARCIARDLLSPQVAPLFDFASGSLSDLLPSAQLSTQNLHCQDLGGIVHEL